MAKPVLQAMVLADYVYRDEKTGKHIIAGTYGRILRQNLKVELVEEAGEKRRVTQVAETSPGTPYLYLALLEVHGIVPLELKVVKLSDSKVVLGATFVVTAADPVEVAEYILPIPLRQETLDLGAYSFDLLHDNEILGSWRLTLIQQDLKQAGETGE